MKQFSTSGFANALQVVAVIILFSYAGRSSHDQSKKILPAKTSVAADTTIEIRSNAEKFRKGLVTGIPSKQ